MKKVTIMVPYSWSDEMVNRIKENYEKDGYEVFIMSVPG